MYATHVFAAGLVVASVDAFLIPSTFSLPDLAISPVKVESDKDRSTRVYEVDFTPSVSDARLGVHTMIPTAMPSVSSDIVFPTDYSSAMPMATGAPRIWGEASVPLLDEKVDAEWQVVDITAGSMNTEMTAVDTVINCYECTFETQDEDELLSSKLSNKLLLRWSLSADKGSLLLLDEPVFPKLAQGSEMIAIQKADGLAGTIHSEHQSLEYYTTLNSRSSKTEPEVLLYDFGFCPTGVKGMDAALSDNGCIIFELLDVAGQIHILNVTNESLQGYDASPNVVEYYLANAGEIEAALLNDEDNGCAADSSISAMFCRLTSAVMNKAEEWNLVQPASNPVYVVEHDFPSRRPCPGRFPLTEDKLEDFRFGDLHLHGGPHKYRNRPWLESFRKEEPELVQDPEESAFHDLFENEDLKDFANSFLHALAEGLDTFVTLFVLPVFIGILAGMAASLLGMVVGSLIGYLWVKLVRGGKRGNATVAQQAREAMVLDEEDFIYEEKEALLDHAPAFAQGEAPPTYAGKA